MREKLFIFSWIINTKHEIKWWVRVIIQQVGHLPQTGQPTFDSQHQYGHLIPTGVNPEN